MPMYKDRRDAGRQLAARLLPYKAAHPVVMALPRGGVPVGYEVAVALAAPLDVVVVRKLGAPGEHELAIGAVTDGDHPLSVLNRDVMQARRVSDEYLRREVTVEIHEVQRRQERYRGGRPAAPIEGRTVIVVDDGIATGASMRAALRGLRRKYPKRLVVAVPVAPAEALESLGAEVDDLVCLLTPTFFHAVGQFYADFGQTRDEEVTRYLDMARQRWHPGDVESPGTAP
jgi:putative phosphoribosyl transferase